MMASVVQAFYANRLMTCVFLSFMSATSWSFFDLLSAINAHTDIYLIVLILGVGFLSAGGVAAACDAQPTNAALRDWRYVAAALVFGAVGIVSNLIYVKALGLIPAGDVVLLSNLSIVYTSFLDSLWRRRAPSTGQWLSLVFSLAGVVLVTQPFIIFSPFPSPYFDSVSVAGYAFAFSTGASATICTILVGVCREIPWYTWVIFIGAANAGCGALGISLRGGVTAPPGPSMAASLAALPLLNTVGRVSNVLATQSHTPTLLALISVIQVPLSYAWGWIWLGQRLNALKFVGVVCVLVGVMLAVVGTKGEEEEEEEEEEGEEEEKKPLKP